MRGLLVAIDTLSMAFASLAQGCLCSVAAAAQTGAHSGLGKIVSLMTGAAVEIVGVKWRLIGVLVAFGAGACTAFGCEIWFVDRVATQARALLCISGMLALSPLVTRQALRPRCLVANVMFAMA